MTATETWHGIREKIPWQPTIGQEKCVNRGKCVKYCSLGTYFEEKDGKKRPVVRNPNNFVILCSGATQSAPWSNIASIQKTNQRANQDPKK